MSIPFNPITISVGKKSLSSFISLQIEQNIGKHHRFQMSVELESGGNRYVHNISENSKKWLGESIVVKAAGTPIFVGVVTNIQLHREGSDFGCIIVSGYSATYRMETAHSCFSWNDTTIGDVVKKLCEQAKVQLELNPEFKENKDYICQYEESDFDFVRRLAHQYQEWMYYDGTKLIFGKPKKLADPIRLEYGTTLSSLDIGLQTLARSEQVFSYHSGSDREMERMTPDQAIGHDKLSGDAFRASLGLFSKPARQRALPRISDESELIGYMGRKQAAETAETHYITAESQVPTLRVGSVVSLYSSFLERIGNISKESLGNFIIIEITHEVSQGSYYKNRFKAIPATIKALPSPKVRMPLAETQMATVLSNADPQGKGRVRVRMNWQTDGMQTGWVRVMTPDGGSSDDVKSNRGFVFIPEVGDQVLLGFRHGDPARPYVMGSLFNGTTGGGGGNSNAIKSITTRSGIQIKLDDNGKSLHIQDASGNVVDMDGKGSMVVNAPNNIQLNATNIDITASNNINMSSGGNLITNVGANWLINVGKIINSMASYMRSTVAFSQKMFSGTSLWSSRQDMKLQSEDITAIGKKKMFLHSEKEFLANSRGTLEMKSDGALSLLPKADKAKTEDHASITMAMVEFRTTEEYDGSFGFDWLRVDDNGLEKKGHYLNEEPYDKIIEGGYNDGKTDLTKNEAYKN
ncbi:type VI secretion system Vgr family protein [Prevotella melaninogenica]|nr:phage baseplate assembly protein V [Prevotella melaninogenica]